MVALPAASSAITVRTEQRSSSGGVTVSEGSATVTGDQSASVNVQTVLSGTRGRVQITTEKDGVQTTETHDINGGTTVQVTPPPPPSQDNGGRTPRENRGVTAVQTTNIQQTNAASVSNSNTSRAKASTRIIAPAKKNSQLAVARVSEGKPVSLSFPLIVPSVQSHGSVDMVPANIFTTLFARILSIFRM